MCGEEEYKVRKYKCVCVLCGIHSRVNTFERICIYIYIFERNLCVGDRVFKNHLSISKINDDEYD